MIEIRRATPADAPALATTLAEAFDGDPVWSWMIPAAHRPKRLERIFGALLAYALPRGHVYTTGDLRSVAVWSPPRQWEMPQKELLKAAPSILRGAGLRTGRLLGRLSAVDRHHARQPPEHWYLEFIGTARSGRGQGLGSAVLSDALRRFDADGLPVYLESSNPRNLPFYRRHGFEVSGDVPVDSGPPQPALWRSPGQV
ncbi:GNAT family N-acetyltransferase [Hamadaea tsunoensis]|uniref:GNAT family N-acetyltransferase n=1 Tax=Hamadaea tsunoensis TaxID=53368 RepID=UPI000415BEED|nr:GNAT family N-acetyltransferase [Hamadaea tsunoensis]